MASPAKRAARRKRRAKKAAEATVRKAGGEVMHLPKSMTRVRKPKVNQSAMTPSGVNVAEWAIPRSEQDRLVTRVSNVKENMVKEYLASIVYPKMNAARVPDSFNRPTALVKSIQTFNIPIKMVYADPVDGGNGGRFSMAIQPFLGSTSSPAEYKTAVVHTDGWALADWASRDNYITVLQGKDTRLDPFYLTLTQNPIGVYLEEGFDSAIITSFFNNGSGTDQIIAQYNTTGIVNVNDVNNDVWRLPFGQYQVSIQAFDSVAVVPGGPTLNGGTVDAVGEVIQSADNTVAFMTYMITVNAASARFTLNWRHTGLVDNDAFITFTPIYYSAATVPNTYNPISENSVPVDDYGLVTSYRTVAMSALATYTGPMLTNGGNIAAAYVPGGTTAANYFNTNAQPSIGNLQNWENLANLPGSYNGKIEDGVYVYWTPEDNEEYELKKPSVAINAEDPPPSLIISGLYAPSQSGLTADQSVIRLEVVTIMEIETNSLVFPSATCVGSQDMIDMANNAMAGQFHAMPNASHMQWLKDFWGGLKQGVGYFEKPVQYLLSNKDKILPLLG